MNEFELTLKIYISACLFLFFFCIIIMIFAKAFKEENDSIYNNNLKNNENGKNKTID